MKDDEKVILTLAQIQVDPRLSTLIRAANHALSVIGYTDHGMRHVSWVSITARQILEQLRFPERDCELAAIAGWVHDVGNAVNRIGHGITGGTLLYPLLMDFGMPMEEIMTIIGAVGNHEEQHGKVISAVSAALIIADKSDANRTRVRRSTYDPNDIHDRVNYSISENCVTADPEDRAIRFSIKMDQSSSVMEFLEIFQSRMLLCEDAADFLGCRFELIINGTVISGPFRRR